MNRGQSLPQEYTSPVNYCVHPIQGNSVGERQLEYRSSTEIPKNMTVSLKKHPSVITVNIVKEALRTILKVPPTTSQEFSP